MNIVKAREISNAFLNEINADPIALVKIGCSKLEISDTALIEIIDHTLQAIECVEGLDGEKFFTSLLNEIIKEKENNGKKK